jgi:hypothetical protein
MHAIFFLTQKEMMYIPENLLKHPSHFLLKYISNLYNHQGGAESLVPVLMTPGMDFYYSILSTTTLGLASQHF